MLTAETEELWGTWLVSTGDTAGGSSAFSCGNSVFEEAAEVALDIVVDVKAAADNINCCLTGVVWNVGGDFWVAALGFRPRLDPPFRLWPTLPKMGRAIVKVLWGWAVMRGALLLVKINLCWVWTDWNCWIWVWGAARTWCIAGMVCTKGRVCGSEGVGRVFVLDAVGTRIRLVWFPLLDWHWSSRKFCVCGGGGGGGAGCVGVGLDSGISCNPEVVWIIK